MLHDTVDGDGHTGEDDDIDQPFQLLAAAQMADAILRDKHKILPCAAYLEGEYGLDGIYMGVPVQLGRKGIEKIIEIELTEEEKAALYKSAEAVKSLFDKFPPDLK